MNDNSLRTLRSDIGIEFFLEKFLPGVDTRTEVSELLKQVPLPQHSELVRPPLRPIANLVHITPITMVYATQITSYDYSYWGLYINQLRIITGGPHIAGYPGAFSILRFFQRDFPWISPDFPLCHKKTASQPGYD